MPKPANQMTSVCEQAQTLTHLFKEWDGKPRIEQSCSLPWPKYTRHDWYLLYTHLLYYPLHNFKEFAEVYGLNYRSSQTWINQNLLTVCGDWKSSKRRWLLDVVQTAGPEIMTMLADQDKHIEKYAPYSIQR